MEVKKSTNSETAASLKICFLLLCMQLCHGIRLRTIKKVGVGPLRERGLREQSRRSGHGCICQGEEDGATTVLPIKIQNNGLSLEQAINKAIDRCLTHGK